MVEALGLKASLQGLKPSQNGVSSGCEFNLREIYYGIRGEATKRSGNLYSQIRDTSAVLEKVPNGANLANIYALRN